MADLLEDLKLLIRTRHAMVTIRTTDEVSAERAVREAGREMGLPVMVWSIGNGLHRIEPPAGGTMVGTETLLGALKFMRCNETIMIYLLKDASPHLDDAKAQRVMREIALAYSRDSRTVFMVDSGGALPAGLRSLAVPFELPLPDEKEIVALVKGTVRELTKFGEPEVEMSRRQFEKFLSNLRGLTRMEISQVVAQAVLDDGKLTVEDIQRVVEFKRTRLQEVGALEYVPPPEVQPSVGGMAALRVWLKKRQEAFSPKAREFGLEAPRGILMLGVQGCGKSLMARYVAARWKMPLLRMDVGGLYNKYVGETERGLRTTFKVASAMAPCVLWIDEIEKAFASAAAGAEAAASDGGLSQRIFGQLLTWMQDHDEPVFLLATANDIKTLPPELMRKGRFDEIFFVDLPDDEARREIFSIHLSKRNRRPEGFDLEALSAAAEGFSGSEIEQAVVSAMYAAFGEQRDLRTNDLLTELEASRPLSVVMAEKIQSLRAWAQGRCVMAD